MYRQWKCTGLPVKVCIRWLVKVQTGMQMPSNAASAYSCPVGKHVCGRCSPTYLKAATRVHVLVCTQASAQHPHFQTHECIHISAHWRSWPGSTERAAMLVHTPSILVQTAHRGGQTNMQLLAHTLETCMCSTGSVSTLLLAGRQVYTIPASVHTCVQEITHACAFVQGITHAHAGMEMHFRVPSRHAGAQQ